MLHKRIVPARLGLFFCYNRTMKPTKYTLEDTRTIDLGTKVIHKYPTPTKDFDIGYMSVDGRHPQNLNGFILESEYSFVMYILLGSGTVYAGSERFNVKAKDVVLVPAKNKFAVEGKLEYITFGVPAFVAEQSSEVIEKAS